MLINEQIYCNSVPTSEKSVSNILIAYYTNSESRKSNSLTN